MMRNLLSSKNLRKQFIAKVFILLIIVSSFLVFLPYLNTYFASDAFSLLYRAQKSSYNHLITHNLGENMSRYYRPLVTIIFKFLQSFFQLNPLFYRLVFLFIHFGNIIMVYLVYSSLTSKDSTTRLAVFLFAFSAMPNSSIIWIAGSLYPTFIFLTLTSFFMFIMFRQTANLYYLMVSLFSFVGGFLNHEMAIILPFLLVVYLWLWPSSDQQKKTIREYRVLLLYLVVAIICLFLHSRLTFSDSSLMNRLVTTAKDPLTLFSNFLYSLSVILWPLAHSSGVFTAWQSFIFNYKWVSFLIIIFLVFISLKNKTAFFALFFTLFSLSFLIFAKFGVDRYLYLAMVGFSLWLAVMLRLFFDYLQVYNRVVANVVLASLLVLYAIHQLDYGAYINIQCSVAGTVAKNVIDEVKKSHEVIPPGTLIIFFDVPEAVPSRFTTIFRYNNIDEAFKLLYNSDKIMAINVAYENIPFPPWRLAGLGGYLYLAPGPKALLKKKGKLEEYLKNLKKVDFPSKYQNRLLFIYKDNQLLEIEDKLSFSPDYLYQYTGKIF